ncbi:MAG: protein kinase [Candidatus Spyradocola sp.]
MSNNNIRQATQVDEGWRTHKAAPEKKATQVDVGWRSEAATPARKATQVDEGWGTGAAPARKATEVDEGWRGGSAAKGRKATQVDEGWRKEVADMLDPANVMNKATANHFRSIEEFKEAVEILTALRSSVGNVYPIKKTISRAGGESIILLCAAPDGNDVVAKVYYEPVNSANSSISTRISVLEYMRTEEGRKYTLAVSDIGLVEFGESRYYFEIMPYCPDTDLADDGAYSFYAIVEITRQLNEALHSIHKAGIIHRDIKPENLYNLDGQIKLGDFGIARNGAAGRSKATGYIAGTEGYAAPETRRYIYSEKSDYYSLGVTLATLFEGHFVFDNMDYNMQALAQESESLPLTRVDSAREQLENLLNGLCRINARQRFGYEDVKRWLADHNYTGGASDEEWPKAFRLLEDSYRDERSMFEGITKDEQHWEVAKEMLYRKYVEQFFMSFRTDLARTAQIADELYRTENTDKGLAIFLKSLYAPGPIVWKGYTFSSLAELGRRMVEAKNPAAYSDLLQNHCVSHWLSNTEGIEVDDETLRLVDEIEALSAAEPEIACYWFGNSFAPERALRICNRKVTTIAELMEALFITPSDFYQTDGYSKLLSRVEGADLYGFLFSFGYKDAVDQEWAHLEGCDLFNKTAILLSMLDNIAVKAGVNPAIIRRFFVDFGPIGIAAYTQKLVASGGNRFYMALDADGKQALARIAAFKAPSAGNVDQLFRAYTPLVDDVERLRRNLIDNPHCILTGVYENKGVICSNLMGCFAFRIFDRVAPLGFSAWIESAKGGTRK